MSKAVKMFWTIIGAYLGMVVLVYIYYNFEIYSEQQPDISVSEAFQLTLLNPTGLTGAGLTMPETVVGNIIAFTFVIISISLFSLFVGKVSDLFGEYREHNLMGLNGTDFTNHFVIIGWDEFAKQVTNELLASGKRVAVISNEKRAIEEINVEYDSKKVFTLYAQLSNLEAFAKANIDKAFRILINFEEDTKELVMLLNINEAYAGVDSVVVIKNPELAESFYESGAKHVVIEDEQAMHLMASHIYEPDVALLTSELLSSLDDKSHFEFQQYYVQKENRFAGKTYGEVFKYLAETMNLLPVGLAKKKGDEYDIIRLPEDEEHISAGDYMILITHDQKMAKLEKLFDSSQGLQNKVG